VTAVQAAVVLPIAFAILISLIIGGMMVFKYQEVAHIARETARFAAVHGSQYASDNAAAIKAGTLPSVDKAYLTSYAQGKAITITPNQIQVSVQMLVVTPGSTKASNTETVDWDNTPQDYNRSPYSSWTDNSTTPATTQKVCNFVIVQVTYTWNAGVYVLGQSVTLTSTSKIPMSY
jgi:hypothetical protein